MPKEPNKPNSSSSHARPDAPKDDVMSLLAEFESSVADLKRMAGQNGDQRSESPRPAPVEPDRVQNSAIRAELEELRTTLSRRALEMDQRAFDLDRRRRELEQEGEQLRKALAEQLAQAQMREKLVQKHESEFAARLTQLTGHAQESDRSRVLAEDKLKATELARSQAEARARELESQIAGAAGGSADVERKLLELSNRIAQAEAELVERRRKSVLDAELLALAEQKRQEAEARSEASRQSLWTVERELGEARDRMARLTAEGVCDTQVQQAVIAAKAKVAELERQVWLHQQEVDRARDERAQALKDAERAGELAAKAEAVAQHTVQAVESLKNQVTSRTAELESERAELQSTIARLTSEIETLRSGAASGESEAVQRVRAQTEAQVRAQVNAEWQAEWQDKWNAQLEKVSHEAQQNLRELSAVAEAERESRVQAEKALGEVRARLATLDAQSASLREHLATAEERMQAARLDAQAQWSRSEAALRDQVAAETECRIRAALQSEFESRLHQALSSETADQVRVQLAQADQQHAAEIAELNARSQASLHAALAQQAELQKQAADVHLQAALQENQKQWQQKIDDLSSQLALLQSESARQQEHAAACASEQAIALKSAQEQAAESARFALASWQDREQQLHRQIQELTLRCESNQSSWEEAQKSAAARIQELSQQLASAKRQSAESEASALALMQAHEEAQARAAADAESLRQQIAAVQNELLQAQSAAQQQAAQAAAHLREALAERENAAADAADKADAQIESLKQDVKQAAERAQSIQGVLEQQIAQQDDIIAALKSSTNDGQAQAAQAQEARLAAEREVAMLRQQLTDAATTFEREKDSAAAALAHAQDQCQNAQGQVQQLRARIDEEHAAHEQAHANLAAQVNDLQSRIAQVSQERDAALADVARLTGDQDASASQAERVIAELRQELQQIRDESAAASRSNADLLIQAHAERAILHAQIEELQVSLGAATAAAAAASAAAASTTPSSDPADAERIRFLETQLAASAEQTGEMEATIAKLAERLKQEVQQRRTIEERVSSGGGEIIDERTRGRMERLRLHRRLRRQQFVQIREAGEVLRKRFEICEQVLAQRAQLAAAHQVIQETQKKQASQRAVGRAAVVMGHGTIVLAILAGLSWAVAGQVAPGRFAARAVLEADGKGRELSVEELKEWQKFHEEMLTDPLFAGKVSEHMKRFAMGPLAEAGAVAERLKTDMSFESARPGVLTVELRGDGPQRTARELNAVTTKLAAEAVEARARRIDGAVTVISKEAAADPHPIDSKRLQVAGMMLGGCAAFGIFVATFIYRRLAAAKQKFERDIALEAILDASRWPKAGGQDENKDAAPFRKAA